MINDVCSEISYITYIFDSLSYQTDLWSEFYNSVESPPGTYIVTTEDTRYVLETLNGSPVALTNTHTDVYSSVTIITSYTNSTPPFSTFPLPAACNQSTCASCYSSAIASTGSLLLLILAIAVQYTVM